MLTADDVASVILERSAPWSDAMRLQKLLYYVQAWHLAVTDEPLFPEQIKAWKQGPVVPQVWHSRRDQATRSANAQHTGHIHLDEMTSNLIDLVLARYGSMSGEELSALTHVEQPWLNARGDLPPDAECRTAISTEDMAAYYRANRKLGGRTAADLAIGGVYIRGARDESVDIDAILDSFPEDDDPGEDPWGGASLESADKGDGRGIHLEPWRAYSDL
ncbi:type II toxin-antitoxin system antitoxin SocA domain-containing protein [Kutzneria sp. NPDC051319]|uniref:Panacea domain-containing protein n=1 Tax=Kutzneria sp. NPDC051319 TaxID=3155047 RepID=UPI0034331057